MAVTDKTPIGVIRLHKDQMTYWMESSRLPGRKERINLVPAVETDEKAVVFEHPIHLYDCGQEPLVCLVIGNRSAVSGGIPDKVRRVCRNEVDTSRRHLPHNFHAVARDDAVDEFIDTFHRVLFGLFTSTFSGSLPAPVHHIGDL